MLKESRLEVNVGLIRGKLDNLIVFVSTAAEKEQAHKKSSGAVLKSAARHRRQQRH